MGYSAHWDSYVRNVYPLRQPVTLLSPLSPSEKGANPLWQAVLSPCHPFNEKFLYAYTKVEYNT